MTNFVFSVTNNLRTSPVYFEDSESLSAEPERLLLRIYGKSSWMFERRKEEEVAVALATAGIIPKWYGIFGNGRFEDFVPSFPVSASEFRTRQMTCKILSSLKDVHDFLPKISHIIGEEDHLRQRVEEWRISASNSINVFNPDLFSQSQALLLKKISQMNFYDGLFIEKLFQRAEAQPSPLVFAHSDVLLQHYLYSNYNFCSCIMAMFFNFPIQTK